MHPDPGILWAAGYLDGEGHFGVYPGRRARIEATSVNPASLYRLQGLFGGTVEKIKRPPRPGWRTAWRWRAYGADARAAAARLLPFLTLKGPEAEAVRDSHRFPVDSEAYRMMVERAERHRHHEYL